MLRDSAAEIEQRGIEMGKLEEARNTLMNGLTPELVVKITGLSEERVGDS